MSVIPQNLHFVAADLAFAFAFGALRAHHDAWGICRFFLGLGSVWCLDLQMLGSVVFAGNCMPSGHVHHDRLLCRLVLLERFIDTVGQVNDLEMSFT